MRERGRGEGVSDFELRISDFPFGGAGISDFELRISDFPFWGVRAFQISNLKSQILHPPLLTSFPMVYDRSRISRQPMFSAGIAWRQTPHGRLAAGNWIEMTKTFFTWASRNPRERSARRRDLEAAGPGHKKPN